MRRRLNIPIDDLVAAYFRGETVRGLAEHYGVCPLTIARRLRQAGVGILMGRPRARRVTCRVCGTEMPRENQQARP